MPTDFYCGVIPAESDNWPFDSRLAVEIEVERDSKRVVDVHVNNNLPGLWKHLRRNLCGLSFAHVTCCGLFQARGTYHADFSQHIKIAVASAVLPFLQESNEDWRTSFREESALRFHFELIDKYLLRPISGPAVGQSPSSRVPAVVTHDGGHAAVASKVPCAMELECRLVVASRRRTLRTENPRPTDSVRGSTRSPPGSHYHSIVHPLGSRRS